ncbi:MAG: tRNA epoxyqueuosine(34) reductase QueG [Chloroflexi bacterium]|nr:tRNA epoxyqueuosine(34) reductase QueG [Chloroflexota bacterium]
MVGQVVTGREARSELADRIRERARELGFDLIGFGSANPFDEEKTLILEHLAQGHLRGMSWITPERVALSCNPDELLPGARSIVGLGTSYASSRAPSASSQLIGRVARYAWGKDYHDVIPPKLRLLAEFIQELGGPDIATRTFVDTGPLVDRAAARRTGVGFVGKNTCLLTGRQGSYVFLSAILCTLDLPADPLVTKDCGSCRACIDACPTEALIAPGAMDATRCISYLTIEHRGSIPRERRPWIGDWVFGCDICQEVCPWNRARSATEHAEFAAAEGVGPELDLAQLLTLDEAGFRSRFRGTPLTRARRAGLLRNAAVVLGNRGDAAAEGVLLAALDDLDPLVREHAAWALGRIGDLSEGAESQILAVWARETDGTVREELGILVAASGRIPSEPVVPG